VVAARPLATGAAGLAREAAARGARGNPTPRDQSVLSEARRLRQRSDSQPAGSALVQPADSASAGSRHVARNGGVGLGIGLVVALGLAFVAELFDRRVNSPRELKEHVGMPVLGCVPSRRQERGSGPRLSAPGSPQSEAYRALRTNLELRGVGHDIRSLLVTSALRAEGKSTTVVNLGAAYARAGQVVTVVDLDLRKPALADALGVTRSPGVADVLLGRTSLEDAIVPAADPVGPLSVLPAGVEVPDPGELVTSPGLRALLEQLRARPGLVLVDAPPIAGIADTIAVSAHVQAVLLVARLGVARPQALESAADALASAPTRAIGVVATGVTRSESAQC
jgi:capsular exopolysaccharide synthesis family protein